MTDVRTERRAAAPASGGGYPHTLFCLIGFYSLAVMWGLRNVYRESSSVLDVVMPLAFAVCLGTWLVVDARRRGHPIPLLSQSWACLFAAIVVPVYLVWSRRWLGVGWVALNGVLWCVVFAASLIVGTYYGPAIR